MVLRTPNGVGLCKRVEAAMFYVSLQSIALNGHKTLRKSSGGYFFFLCRKRDFGVQAMICN